MPFSLAQSLRYQKLNPACKLYEAEIDFIEPSPDLMMLAIELAFNHKVTIYDALYLALAKMFDIPFITADRKLHRAVKLPQVKLLSEI